MGNSKKTDRATAATLRANAEAQLQQRTADFPQPHANTEVQRLLHELQVHQIELEMQNDELKRTQCELESSLEKYTDLYDFAPVGYVICDRQGVISAVNFAGSNLLGCERSRIIGKRFGQFITNEYGARFTDFLETVFTNQGTSACEMVLHNAVSSPVFVQLNAIVVNSGQDCRIALSDITSHKQAEADLRKSEALYRAIGETINYGVWVCAPDGRNVYASESFLKMVGITQQQCSDFGWGDLLHPDDAERTIAAWQECVRIGGKWDIEHRFKGVDGHWHHVLARGVPVRDEHGEITSWAGINLDIDRLKQADEALQQLTSDLDRAQQVGSIGSWRLDVRSNVLSWSAENHRIFGIPQGEPMTYESFLATIHPDDRHAVDSQWQAALRGAPYDIEHRLVVNGQIKWVREKAYLEFEKDGSLIGGFGITQDFTERKTIAEELQAREQRIQQALQVSRSFTFAWTPETDEVKRSASCGPILHLTGDDAVSDTGTHYFQSVHPDDRARFVQILKGLSPESNSYLTEYRYVCNDGVEIVLEETGQATFDAGGVLRQLVGVSADITTRKQAEEGLRAINQELEQRVLARTAELDKTIDILSGEIYEREVAQKSLLRLNRLYAALSETNHAIIKNQDRDALFSDFCRIAVDYGGYILAWVGLLDPANGEVRIAHASGDMAYLETIRVTANLEPMGAGPTGMAIRSGTYFICNDFQNDPTTLPWHDLAKAHGIFSSASIAIKENDRVIGALALYADETDYFDEQQVELLVQMGLDISFALDNLSRETVRQAAEQALQQETLERLQTAKRLRANEQLLIQQSRQAAMGEMIGNIAHQWRQPLNTLGLTVQQLQLFYELGKVDREFMAQSVNRSMDLIQHMSHTIDDFRNYFKPDKEKVTFKMQEALQSTVTLIGDTLTAHNISTELIALADPVIVGYRNEFSQAVLNILHNAKDILTERNVAHPRVTVTICLEGDCAVVTIADNGGGIPEEIMTKIFDPYFTTKGPQHGTGVGLFMTKSIIEKNMGGKLTVRNNDEGAEFRIEVCNES